MSKLDPWVTETPGLDGAGRAMVSNDYGMVTAWLAGAVWYFEPEDAMGFAEALAAEARTLIARRGG